MPDTIPPQMPKNRRSTDSIWLDENPDVAQMLKDIRGTQLDMIATLKAQSRAFVPNEFSEPDYDGHRKDHVKLATSEKLIESYKESATKRIINIALAFVFGLMAVGFFEYIKKGLGN